MTPADYVPANYWVVSATSQGPRVVWRKVGGDGIDAQLWPGHAVRMNMQRIVIVLLIGAAAYWVINLKAPPRGGMSAADERAYLDCKRLADRVPFDDCLALAGLRRP